MVWPRGGRGFAPRSLHGVGDHPRRDARKGHARAGDRIEKRAGIAREELALADNLWAKAVRSRRPHLVTVVGEPGIGKSRLVAEVERSIGAAGGCVYRGPVISLRGRYFFGDYVSERIWSLVYDPVGGQVVEFLDWTDAFVPEGRWVQIGVDAPTRQNPFTHFSFYGLLALGIAATGVGILVLLALPLNLAFVLLPFLGIALNGTSSVLYATVAEFVDARRHSRGFGLFMTMTIGASALSPTIFGVISDLNGVPATGNRFLLQRVLRDEWRFDGFVVSDWASIQELRVHGFTASDRDSVVAAANAGVNMDMASRLFGIHRYQGRGS